MPDDLTDIDQTVHTTRVISVVRGILQAYSTATEGVSFRSNLAEIVSPLMKMYKYSSTALPPPLAELYKLGLNMEWPARI